MAKIEGRPNQSSKPKQQPVDSVENFTAAGPAFAPLIRLFAAARARWGAGSDRRHSTILPTFVCLRTLYGGGDLRFDIDGVERTITVWGPSVILFKDTYLERIITKGDRWDICWFEFLADEQTTPPTFQVVEAPELPDESSVVDEIAAKLVSPKYCDRVCAAATFSSLLHQWFSPLDYDSRDLDIQTVNQASLMFRQLVYDLVSVEEVAKTVGVHPVKLRKLFHQHFSCSPKQYYDRVRMEEARRLLETGMLAKQVATRLGFTSSSHFTKVFKEFVGLTIREYRARYYEDYDSR